MDFQLQPTESPETGSKRIILDQVNYIHSLMINSPEGRDKAVHEARKSCKRIRAVLRLIRDEIGPDAYHRENTHYRDASRLLAPVRDSAIAVEVLDKLITDHAADLPENSFNQIRDKLAARHEEFNHRLLDEQDIMAQVAERMGNGRERILALTIPHNDFTAFAPGLKRVYQRGRRRMALAYAGNHNPELFHDWRKRVKYLWHHLEILLPIWPAILSQTAVELHRLSDILGDAHDLEALRHILASEPARFAADPELPALLTLIERRRPQLETAAQPLGQRLYHEKPSLFLDRVAAYWSAWQSDILC